MTNESDLFVLAINEKMLNSTNKTCEDDLSTLKDLGLLLYNNDL